MSVAMHNTGVYTEFQGLKELKVGARQESPEAVREVARQFESLFVQMMLKNMRAASLGDGMFDNDQSKLYMEMFDKQVAMDMSKGQGIGLADMLVKQLTMNSQNAEQATDTNRELSSASLQRALQSYGVQANTPEFSPENPQAFISQVWPHAQKAASELGIDPKALVAQAALETGWGQNMIKRSDGSNSFNFFGIKAGDSWQGERATTLTHEYSNGVKYNQHDEFRAYSSIEASFSDYVNFLKSNPRYSDVVSAGAENNLDAYVDGLQKAGYATDPNYANKIKDIVDRSAFNQSLAMLRGNE